MQKPSVWTGVKFCQSVKSLRSTTRQKFRLFQTLRVFSCHNLNVIQMIVFEREENIVVKGESAGKPAFFSFSQDIFKKLMYEGCSELCGKGLKGYIPAPWPVLKVFLVYFLPPVL